MIVCGFDIVVLQSSLLKVMILWEYLLLHGGALVE